jgi:malate permease and related proteins
MLDVIAKILPIILLIALGNVLQKFQFFKVNTIEEFKKLIVNITLPAMLFLTFAETAFESHYLVIFIVIFIVCVLLLFVGLGLKKLFKSKNKYFPTLFTSFENGMIGYALFVTVYGTPNLYKIAVIDLGHILFVFLILVSYIQKLDGKSATGKDLIFSCFKSPIVLAVLLGILLSSTGSITFMNQFTLTSSFFELLALIGSLTVPIICIVIGYELKIDFKNLAKPFGVVVLRMSLLLVTAYLINTFIFNPMQLDKHYQMALYTTFLLPPAFAIPIFMDSKEEESKKFILNVISINIVLAIAAFLVLLIVL